MKRMGNLVACVMLAGVLAACGGGDGDGGSTLSVSATGSATQGTTVGAGGSTTLNVQSSDFIRLQTSQPVRWQAVITSDKTTVTNQVLTETQWSGNLVSPTGDAITLTATQVSDPSKVFTLKIAVAPQRYNAGPYKVGQVATFAETQVRFNGTSTVENLAYTVVAVNNGLATITSANADTNAPDTSYVQDLDRNRLSRTYTNGNVCTYSPKRALRHAAVRRQDLDRVVELRIARWVTPKRARWSARWKRMKVSRRLPARSTRCASPSR